MESRKTPLYQKHVEKKGRMVDFSGWLLPVEYESVLKEAKSARSTCGIFDASHMGEIVIKGRGAFSFLQNLTPNDISLISKGQMQYNLLLNEKGGVIDDLMVYNQGKQFLCVVNASNKDKVLAWFSENKTDDVDIEDRSDCTALISLQGPLAIELMTKVVGEAVKGLKYMNFDFYSLGGSEALISRSGYTGEDGVEIYPDWEDACSWWDAIVEKSKNCGLTFCGLGARDILRIEAGYPLYGHELNEDIDPYTARLAWVVKADKDFIAKDKLLEIKRQDHSAIRIGFIMKERGLARQGYPVYFESRKIGQVCSGTFSPNANVFLGMAYVEKGCVECGKEIEIEIRNRFYKAEVSKWPFVELSAGKNSNNSLIKRGAI